WRAPNALGPFPGKLLLDAGKPPKAKLAEGSQRGLWVTRLHYLSVVHPLLTILTGMTRDGTFLIENGEITRPIKNLRFNQSVLEGWKSAKFSATTKQQKGCIGGTMVPAARIDKFTFVIGTSF